MAFVDESVRADRFYVAVRADLPFGLQMAQAIHAAFLYAQQDPEGMKKWLRDSQYVVVVAVPDDVGLHAVLERAAAEGVRAVVWREPDLDDAVTAVALQPGEAARRLCANLPLAGRPDRNVRAV